MCTCGADAMECFSPSNKCTPDGGGVVALRGAWLVGIKCARMSWVYKKSVWSSADAVADTNGAGRGGSDSCEGSAG
jgi:hypothetical protein